MNGRVDRRTIYVGRALEAMLASGSVAGRSISERIDRLASRHAAMVASLIPTRWSLADWRTTIDAVRDVDLDRPSDALVVALRLRQMSKENAAADIGSVAYRFENLRPAEQLAIVDVAERAIAAGQGGSLDLPEWLRASRVQFL